MLKEYRERDKSNVFRDRRLEEYSSSVSPEEKMARRFALEQQVCGSGRVLRTWKSGTWVSAPAGTGPRGAEGGPQVLPWPCEAGGDQPPRGTTGWKDT